MPLVFRIHFSLPFVCVVVVEEHVVSSVAQGIVAGSGSDSRGRRVPVCVRLYLAEGCRGRCLYSIARQ